MSKVHDYVKHDLGRDEFRKIHPNLRVLDISVNTRAEVDFFNGLSPHVKVFVSLQFEDFSYVDKYGRQVVAGLSEITDPSRFAASFRADYYLDTKFGETPISWNIHAGRHGVEDNGVITNLGDVWLASREDLKARGKENPSDKEIFNNLSASVQIARFSNGKINPKTQIRWFIEEKLQEQEKIEKEKEQEKIREEERERNQTQASETAESSGGQDDTGEVESYTSGNDAGKTEKTSSKRSKEEVEAEKQRQRDAARRRDEERQRSYMARKQAQNEQNRQLAYSSAAASASMLYLLGGVIYSQYGKTDADKLYRGSNLFTNLDLGFSLSTHPLYFASEKEDYNYDITKKTVSKNTITIDLNLNLMLGYDTDNVGGYAFAKGTAGMSPIFDTFMFNYDYGGRLYGGLKNLKVFGEYQSGNREISTSDFLDSQEYGSGKSNHSFTNVKAGIKISWYNSGIAPARHHIYLGLIEEKITGMEAGKVQRIPNETEPYFFTGETTYTGYMFEWRHDQHGIFFVNVFPKYPLTGVTGGPSSGLSDNDGNLYFQIGFLRSFGAFH